MSVPMRALGQTFLSPCPQVILYDDVFRNYVTRLKEYETQNKVEQGSLRLQPNQMHGRNVVSPVVEMHALRVLGGDKSSLLGRRCFCSQINMFGSCLYFFSDRHLCLGSHHCLQSYHQIRRQKRQSCVRTASQTAAFARPTYWVIEP